MYKDKSLTDSMKKNIDDAVLGKVSGGFDRRDQSPDPPYYHCNNCGRDTGGEAGGFDEDGNQFIVCTYCHAPL